MASRSSPIRTGSRAGAGRYWPIWAVAVPILLWAVIRCLGLERGFPLVPFMAYTPYVAVAAFFVAGIAVALRNWAAAAVSTAAVACLLAAVLPRAFGDGSDAAAQGGPQLRVLSANIYRGKADPVALVALVESLDVDVLCVQELTPRFARELDAAGIRGMLPSGVVSVRARESGGGIYSHFPVRRLSERQPFGFRMPRAAVVLPGGRRVRIVDVHPYTPKRDLEERWKAGLSSLPLSGPGGVPWVLAGDFNATLDHRQLREVIDRGYDDAADLTGRGLEPTWPVGRGILPPPITIDHVLADRRLGVAEYAVEDLPGSDHRAVYARLLLP